MEHHHYEPYVIGIMYLLQYTFLVVLYYMMYR